MARILVDKDQTIADFNKNLCILFKLLHPDVEVKQANLTSFYFRDNFPQVYGPDIAAIHNSQSFILSLPLIRGARKAIYEMIDQGHQVIICTSPLDKNPHCMPETKVWIAKKFPGKRIPVIFASDKTIVLGDYLIDDKPHIIGANPTPTWKRIVFDQPHNRNLDPQIPRIRSWHNWPSVIQ